MNQDQLDVKKFYDDFVVKQAKIGVSVRHRLIFKALKRIGLKKNSNVLEVGCGIGTASSLIIKHITQGKFVGCDISEASIKFANDAYQNPNVNFYVDSMENFTSDIEFDFAVFPDVLEHIPVEQHSRLFENISKCCKPDAKVLINIPEPNTLNWYRKNHPEKLQIIDQSLSMQDLLNNIYPHGFQVQSIIPYSIHTYQKNYLSIVLIRNSEIKEIKLKGKFQQAYQNFMSKF